MRNKGHKTFFKAWVRQGERYWELERIPEKEKRAKERGGGERKHKI